MSKHELISVFVKLGAIYCLVQFLPSLPVVISFLSSILNAATVGEKLTGIFAMVILPAIWIGLCVWVVQNSRFVAKKICSDDSDIGQFVGLSFTEFQALAYSIVGLVLIVNSIPKLVEVLTYFMARPEYGKVLATKAGIKAGFLPQILSFLVQFLLGFVIFLNPRGVRNFWRRFKVREYKAVDSESDLW